MLHATNYSFIVLNYILRGRGGFTQELVVYTQAHNIISLVDCPAFYLTLQVACLGTLENA